MADERNEITLTVSDLEQICSGSQKDRKVMLDHFKEKAGYSGFTNFETYKTYLFLMNNLKITNKKGLDTSAHGENIGFLAEYLSEFFPINFSNFRNYDFYSQALLENAIKKINWREIAKWMVGNGC